MGKIVGIDFGLKRTGIAITDNLNIIASGLDTIETVKVVDYLIRMVEQDNIKLSLSVKPFVIAVKLHL